MDNYAIADHFALLAKLMEVHGENSFKAKSYANTAFQLEKVLQPLAEMDEAQLASLKGVGASAASKITEIIQSGRLSVLDKLIAGTPPGILEMMNIKGLGPKKIQTVWKEMQLETVGELMYACEENRLMLYKGFGQKTQDNIRHSIEFYLNHQGQFLYQQVEEFIEDVLEKIKNALPENCNVEVTGDARRCSEVIRQIDFLVQCSEEEWKLAEQNLNWISAKTDGPGAAISYKLDSAPSIFIHRIEASENFAKHLFELTGPESFTTALSVADANYKSEEEIFTSIGLPHLHPLFRDNEHALKQKVEDLESVIKEADIKGIIHTHSTWSDGSDSIETMAEYAITKGFEYLVISDHSRTAVYANGLSIDRILAQHKEIDQLNKKLSPFKIFKSVESDILNDGSLDYPAEILATFDLVIGSVHSNLKMTADKAMERLLKAISNPYLTILGHPTGRLLLSRAGYPVNHTELIAACRENNVVIELNAHPRRLDLDWRFIQDAVAAGVKISVDPDAHASSAFHDILYGVLAARKGLLKSTDNLSSLSLAAFETYLASIRKIRGNHW